MRSSLLISLLVALVCSASCNTGFVRGWGADEDDRADPATAPARCEAHEGWSWIGGSCKEDAALALANVETPDECQNIAKAGWWDGHCIEYSLTTEEQCGEIVAWSWSEGRCVENAQLACEADPIHTWVLGVCVGKPVLTTEGALSQVVAAGSGIAPIKLAVSVGATLELRSQSCAGYFSIDGASLKSTDGYELAGGTTQCTATLVPRAGEADGEPVTVTATLERGFFAICTDPNPTDVELATALALMQALEKVDCKEANLELVKAKHIILPRQRLKDLTALRGLSRLEWLDLSDNQIEDLSPLASATGLLWLDLTLNQVKSLAPIATLPKLARLLITEARLEKTEATCPTVAGTAAPVIRACTR